MVEATPVPERVQTNEEATALLKQIFHDAPTMVEIAKCESQFRQWDQTGEVLRGKVNPKDRGIFQINEDYHLETSRRLGYDIYTAEGNISYARLLYDEQGITPWRASGYCWSK